MTSPKAVHFAPPGELRREDDRILIDIDEIVEASEEDDQLMSLEEKARMFDHYAKAADRLSVRLLSTHTPEEEEEVLRHSLDLSSHRARRASFAMSERKAKRQTGILVVLALVFLGGIVALLVIGVRAVGPPKQPVGKYQLVERQEGMEFFDFYDFYEGPDSVGSNGYNTYVGEARALELGIVNVTMEKDILDIKGRKLKQTRSTDSGNETSIMNITSNDTGIDVSIPDSVIQDQIKAQNDQTSAADDGEIQDEQTLVDSMPGLKKEPFIYMMSAPTPEGPREAIRLEGKQRFNRGLFIIDLRHMPAGCGVWPAFWLTDEANWPVNGEIDIVEGVNYQSAAKTALHSTQGCSMDDIPMGVKTGSWDTAVGIPDKDTGIPDMTLRYATNCFVYDPHQWLNQGCVAVDLEGGSLGVPLNRKGGGVYVLEWDPIYRHIRTWVFAPHTRVPENLRETISTASNPDPAKRVDPDPELWPLPYGYFAIGDGTDCHSSHFKNMRLVFNLAFCGSVAGNRYHLDCPIQAKKFDTCIKWVKSQPDELNDAYWKIRGVYVYQREWIRAWM